MKEILFRGFHPCDGPDTIVVDGETVKGEWVVGNLVHRTNYYGDPCDDYFVVIEGEFDCDYYDAEKVLPSTVGQYTNIDIRREAWPQPEKHKTFTGDILGEWGEDEDGNECVCILGVVTYWENEGRYVLTDENGLANDWTFEDEAKPENWKNLIHCGTIWDEDAP